MTPLLSVILIAGLANLFLGLFVWLNSKKDAKSISYGFLGIATGLWAIINLVFQLWPSDLLLKLTYSFGALVPALAAAWVLKMAEIRKKPIVVTILSLGLIFFLLPLVDKLVISGQLTNEGISEAKGPLFSLYSIYALTLTAVTVALSYYFFVKAKGITRKQWQLIFLGILGFATVSSLVSFILPTFNVFDYAVLDSASSVIFVSFAAYAITRHGLFNIKVVLAEMATAAIVIESFIEVIASTTASEFIFRVLLTIFLMFFGYLLVRSVQNEVRRREEVERLAKERIETLKELEQRNKNLAVLQRISKLVLNEIEMKPMVQKILDEIPRQFEVCNGALLNLRRKDHLVSYAYSANEFSKKITSLVGADLEQYSYPLQRDFNLLHNTLLDQKMTESTRLADFISPPIQKAVASTVQGLMGMKYIIALPLMAKDEPLGVLMFAFKVPKELLPETQIQMAIAIADDMSLALQRVYAYQQLKDANTYLADLDKLKDEFISMASHELNTPLAAVEGYLSMILEEGMGKIDAQARKYLERAYDSSKRLAELILDLLNVSRIEQGRLKMKFAETNLYELAQSVVNELQIKSDAKKLSLKLEGRKGGIPMTWCDPDRIREVFVNLVGNAIKYTERGGITIKITENAGRMRCEVVDTGRGISKVDQNKLFQKFSQVKREIDEHQGTGLGLYISKNFVELHKGRIWVESEEGKGSDFIFELPILKEAPKEVEGAILEQPLAAPQVELQSKSAYKETVVGATRTG